MSSLKTLRAFALVEGVSLLVLVLIAMPLKYFAELPIAVRVVGSLHGLAFILFVVLLARTAADRDWGPRIWLSLLGASVVPGGVFFVDRLLKQGDR